MNLWIPHGPAARAEAILSEMANWFISTKTGGPVNGEVQDGVVGLFRLTRSAARLDRAHAMRLFRAAGVPPPAFDRPEYSGREVVSLLLTRHAPVNYRRPPSFFSEVYTSAGVAYAPDETEVVIEEGRLLRGVLDKRAVGAKSSGGLFHLVARSYGPQRALDMIYALQQMAVDFLELEGFTIGTTDLLTPPAARERVADLVSAALLEAELNTGRLLAGKIIPRIGETTREFYEQQQIQALKVDDAERLRWVLSGVDFGRNGFVQMVATGAKGSNPNILHVMASIGQITINGSRIREQFGFRRTLAYFPRYATSPFAYGFVANSYVSGMTSTEWIFSDMSGRFDLINKALSTASTGYFMRKGVMNNQSSVVDNYRRVVKDARIVQALYGEDGIDGRRLERVALRTVPLSDADLRARYALAPAALAAFAGAPAERDALAAASDAALAAIRADRDAYRALFLRIEDADFNRPMLAWDGEGRPAPADASLPVNIARVLGDVRIAERRRREEGTPPPPAPTAAAVLRRIERAADLVDRLPYRLLNAAQERRRAPVPPHLSAATCLMAMQARAELAPPVLAELTDAQLEYVVRVVEQGYEAALIDYGSAAGILAAQAVSEPLTQYMLDSHHRSVAGGTSKSGLVRVSEIYGALPVAKEVGASMLLRVRPELEHDAARVQEVANSIEYLTFGGVVAAGGDDILFEPYGRPVYPPYAADAAWIAEFERCHPLLRPPADITRWALRFVIDRAALVLKNIGLEHIVVRLRAAHPQTFVVHTPESVPSVVVRVYLRAGLFRRGADEEERAREELAAIRRTPIRGVPGIAAATVTKRLLRHRVAPDGALVQDSVFAVRTEGTNLFGALASPAVDPLRAISSSVGDTFLLYGIEAAREKIIRETQAFMSDGAPNARHLMVYGDEMTATGRVTSFERAGLSTREHRNTLLRMANAAPIQVVTEAALSGATSRVYGIAAPLLLGATPQIGSLYNQLVVNERFVRENAVSVDSVLDAL